MPGEYLPGEDDIKICGYGTGIAREGQRECCIKAKLRGSKEMGRKHSLIWAFLLLGGLTTTALGDEIFEPVKVVYMNNGEAIFCQMGSIDGTRMICRRANGSVSLPLENVNFEKTFPKYKKQNGETILLVHAGQLYRDENTIISDLRMIREAENPAAGDRQERRKLSGLWPGDYAILCNVTNRGDPCEVRVSVIAKDGQGRTRYAIGLDSRSRIDAEQNMVLKKRLDGVGAQLESQIVSLKIADVERRNVLQRREEETGSREAKMSPEKLREQRIRSLKESFLK
jgi:hypothetical protein